MHFELPLARGFAYMAWAIENDGWMQLSGVSRASPGYIRQEVKRLMDMIKTDGK